MDNTVLRLRSCAAGLALCLVFVSSASAASRIKDIGHFAGVRSNALSGYGLVIGLNKTGDKRQTFFTQQTLLNMLERFGLTINNPSVRVENIAAVMVTTDLGAFEKPGSRIDVVAKRRAPLDGRCPNEPSKRIMLAAQRVALTPTLFRLRRKRERDAPLTPSRRVSDGRGLG